MQVVVRALNILRLLSTTQRGLSLAEVAERLGLAAATAHRLVGVLEAEQFVTRSTSNRRYFLGPAARELYQVEQPRASPLVTPHASIGKAAADSGETVFLSEKVGSKVVCIALAESRHPLRLFVRVGQEMPLHAAASARVLLAWRDPADVRKMFDTVPLRTFTGETPSDVDQVIERMALIRGRGYDVCEAELEESVWAVSAPVRSSTDAISASVTLAAPLQRMQSQRDREGALEIVLAAAGEMATDLGWAGSAPA